MIIVLCTGSLETIMVFAHGQIGKRMKLINVDAYSKKICAYNETGCGSCVVQTTCPFDEPIVDAEPVKHGYWIFSPKDAIEMMFTLPKCSECGTESADGGNYCPNCGAKMDK